MNDHIEWVKTTLRNWKDFAGRSRRREYWTFVLASVIVQTVLGVVDKALFDRAVLGGIMALILLVPSLAVAIRRLHDTGKSGWWLLTYLIPPIGLVVVTIFTLLNSTPGANRFGPNPKGEDAGFGMPHPVETGGGHA